MGLTRKSRPESFTSKRLIGMRVTTSLFGRPIPILYGTDRISANLIDYIDFKAVSQQQQAGGKGLLGGGGKGGTTVYDYYAAVMMALCEGPGIGIVNVFNSQGPLTLQSSSETFVVPGGGTYRATKSDFYADHGASRADSYSQATNNYGDPNGPGTISGTQQTPLVQVASSPAAGQYSVDSSGNYTFNAADIGKTVTINYVFSVPNSSTNGQPLATLGFTFFNGAHPQTAWGYMTTNHPSRALGYDGICYLACPSLFLGPSGALPAFTFEVKGQLLFGAGILDCDPSAVIADLLTNPFCGAGFPSSYLDTWLNYQAYCLANGLFLSVFLDQQDSAANVIQRILEITNSEAFFSDNLLKIVPYGDTAAVGNGKTFLPATSPIFDLTDDDFLIEGNNDPVECEIGTAVDAFNQVTIEYLDRSNAYNTGIFTLQDDGSIDLITLRPQDVQTYHEIKSQTVAKAVASLQLRRLVYIRNKYKFKTSGAGKCSLLEQMDLVTITDAKLGLSKAPVRILDKIEDEKKMLSFVCEEFPWGTANPTLYPNQPVSPYVGNSMADPGFANIPIIIEATNRVTGQTGYELWIAASGGKADLPIANDLFAVNGSPSASWTVGVGTFSIVGGALKVTTSSPTQCAMFWNAATFLADQFSQATLVNPGAALDFLGPAVRMNGAGTTYYTALFNPNGGNISLLKVVSGIGNTTLATYAHTPTAGDVLFLEVRGGKLTVKLNGATIITVADTDIASGNPGIMGEGTFAPSMTVNDWIGGNVGVSPNWGGCSVWLSADGTTYEKIGTIFSPARTGVLTAALPSHSDPDTVDTLSVDVTESGATLLGGTAADADNDRTLCLVDTELISYQTATLTSAFHYDLGTRLRRGQMGSAIAAHAIGAPFVRIDSAIFKWGFDPSLIGQTLHFKFTSFNLAEQMEQSLAEVADYPVTIVGSAKGTIDLLTGLVQPIKLNPSSINWNIKSGLGLTQSGTTTTILIASGVVTVEGSDLPTINSGSVNPGAYGEYMIFYDDPAFVGGTVTFQALLYTVANFALAQSGAPGRFYLGIITTSAGGGGTGGGGGGGTGGGGRGTK